MLSKNIKIKIHRTIILFFALYGCETWSLTLREEHRVRVFANRVLKSVLSLGGTKKQGSRKDFIKRSFFYLYSIPNIIRMVKSRRMRWAGHVEWERRHIQCFGWKTRGKETTWKTLA